MRENLPRSLAALAAVGGLLGLAGCAVPLAPGYRVARETRHIRFLPGPPPALEIRGEYRLVNSGSGKLPFVEVRLPSEKDLGGSGVRVEVDGRPVTPEPVSDVERHEPSEVVRIPFARPWMPKQKRELRFDYTLRSPTDSGSDMTLESGSFHLGLRGWAPQFQPPKFVLSSPPSRPGRMDYTIRVPGDFLVLAGGTRKRRKKYGNETEYQFELRANDLGPFVVAGRFVKWPETGGQAEFWSARPLHGDVTVAGREIAAAWKTLTSDFGVVDRNIRVPRVIQSAAVEVNRADPRGPAAVAVPGAALVNPAALALGITSEPFLEIVSEALARSWFDLAVTPNAGAAIGMGAGLPEYASIVIDEARHGPLARRQRIYQYLRRYDQAVKQGEETPLAATTWASPLAERRIALAKAPLFYVALEDRCGEAPVRAGIAHLLASMRGQPVDYDVLRSALEESTGRELGELFRQWLHRTGLPKNFRARYPYGGSRPTADEVRSSER